MKKITLLYEANLLTHREKNANRTGIFFTAYNVLKQLAKDANFNIILYISNDNSQYIKEDVFLSQFQFIKTYPNRHQLKRNIEIHKNNIKQTSNIINKLCLFPEAVKEHLYLFFNIPDRYRKKNKNLFKSIDAFFSPIFAPNDEILQYKNILHFIVLYDAIPLLYPEFFPNLENHWYTKVINSLNKHSHYFCISGNTKRDFLKLFPNKLDENKVITMPIAAAQDFFPEHNSKKLAAVFLKYGINYNTNHKYLFSFCSLDPRKNLFFTIKCFILFIKKYKINDLYFYLGGREVSFFNRLEKVVGEFADYRDKFTFLGYIDDEDVNILYSNALFFTYISQYEGFGMPPLEAMRAGVPVVTSNNSSLPEVVGDAAITIDYDSEEQCVKAFEDLYFKENLRKSYVQKGLERAKLFSWEKTAKIISDTIHNAVEKRNNSY
jgi:glycosyltransferase involved in cell wall biosynthesis